MGHNPDMVATHPGYNLNTAATQLGHSCDTIEIHVKHNSKTAATHVGHISDTVRTQFKQPGRSSSTIGTQLKPVGTQLRINPKRIQDTFQKQFKHS